jgi:hypothetical protein
MKLEECIKIGKECGLITLGEAYDNINHHQTMLFAYTEMEKEMQELRNEIGKKYNLNVISDNINRIKI